nr:hypothetical protein [Tanacetum cinerariifolium]
MRITILLCWKNPYDSWKSRMELYIENRENCRMILNSVQNGPLVWPTIVEENGTTRTKNIEYMMYEELSVAEKLQADCDLKATNIVLQGDDPIACLNKAMAFVSAVAASRFPLTNNQLRTSSNLRNQAIIKDGRTKDIDAYDSDCNDVFTAQVVLMANLSNYGSDVISERIKPTLYDGSVVSSQHVVILVIDDEETLILEEISRSKMLAKQNDPISKGKKVNNTTPINYVELNRLSEDFGERFFSQQELSAEQAFWLQTSHLKNCQVRAEVQNVLKHVIWLAIILDSKVFSLKASIVTFALSVF